MENNRGRPMRLLSRLTRRDMLSGTSACLYASFLPVNIQNAQNYMRRESMLRSDEFVIVNGWMLTESDLIGG